MAVRPVLLAAFALLAFAPAAPAAGLYGGTVSADRASARSCLQQRAGGTVVKRRVTADVNGLIRARLSGDPASDWDLAVFDAARGRLVAGSAHFGSTELAEGLVHGGQELIVQACRRRKGGRVARLSVVNIALPPAPAGKPKLVRVLLPTQADKDLLLSLDLDLAEHGRPGFLDVLLHGDADEALLRRSGLRYEVVVADVVAADRAALTRAAGPPDGEMPSGRVNYRRLPEVGEDMKRLVAENPSLVKPITLAHASLEGRPIEGVEITENVNARDGKPVFLQLGVHHAREWPSAEMPLEFAFELVNTFKAGSQRTVDLLRRARVIVVPVVNPDGFNLSRETPVDPYAVQADVGFAYKRKNCRVADGAIPAPGECGLSENRDRGVDPNRNYGGFWGGPGASTSPGSDTYRGAGPFSEPETQGVRELVSARQVVTLITNHTYSDLVLRPPGLQSGPEPPDEAMYKALGDAMAAENGYTSQRGYELYDTTGTTEDWSYFTTGGLGFTFEIGKGETVVTGSAVTGSGFHPPYPVGVVAEWFGKYPQGGGNREAYYIALESTVDAARHSVLEGSGPAGATIRLHKEFDTAMRAEVGIHDVLDTSTEIPSSGSFEYHVNPSQRPAVVLAGGSEPWTLTCEFGGRVVAQRPVNVARGERSRLGEVCGTAASHPAGLSVSVAARRPRLGVLARRGLAVTATCSAACDLSARLRRGSLVVARGTRRAAAGKVTLRLKPTRAGTRALRRARRATLTLDVTASSGTQRATARRTLKLRR